MSYRVIQITDCHLHSDKSKAVGDGVISFDTLEMVLKAIKPYDPDLVVVTGDLSADESEQSYQYFNQLWSTSKIDAKLLMIPGNHDDANLMQRHCPESYWHNHVFEVFDWKLHCLHSQIPGEGRGCVSDMQLNRLKQAIELHPLANHVVVVHHHPVAMNSWMDKYEWTNRKRFVNLVESHDAIKIVMHGHVHTERDIGLGQARLMATPSTCWQFKHDRDFAFDDKAPAFRIVDLKLSGEFDTAVIFIE